MSAWPRFLPELVLRCRDGVERALARRIGPPRARRLLQPVFWGTARRTRPLSDEWGFDRGTPVDRHYIEGFLAGHGADIRGTVLEIKDSAYTRRFGRGVERVDVLDVDPANPHATLACDLARADGLPEGAFDCFVLTQTLQLIYEVQAAIRHGHRLLRPGGVLLATVPAVSRIVHEVDGVDYWRFTVGSCRRLFGDVFGAENVTVRPYGNVFTGMAFLMGVASEELAPAELDASDPYFPLVITVRAVKRAAGPG